MKKRLLSVILACVLAFGFVSPVLAADVYLPASAVQFTGNIGYGASLSIDTNIVVDESYINEEISEYPALYTLDNGVLTLVHACTANDWSMGAGRGYDPDGNPLPWQASVSVIFTEDEYNAFDFTADYVLKIPGGIFADESGNPIGENYVSFSGADINIYRYELTLFGQIHEYLWSLNETPLFNIFILPLISILNFFMNAFNIPLAKPLF